MAGVTANFGCLEGLDEIEPELGGAQKKRKPEETNAQNEFDQGCSPFGRAATGLGICCHWRISEALAEGCNAEKERKMGPKLFSVTPWTVTLIRLPVAVAPAVPSMEAGIPVEA